MKTPPWYVITGGPCAGKTTLLRELERRGYQTVPEDARAHIESELAAGKTLAEIRRDEAAFQRALIPMKRAAMAALPRDATVFFDRGMHDSITYFALAGITHEPALAEALAESVYRKAFLLDLLPFVADNARTEDEAEARRIHEMLRTAYEEAEIPVITVPVLPVAERADFVLAHL